MLRRIYSIYSLISYWYKTIKIPEHFALCLITVMCDILYVDMHVPTFVHAFMTESNYNGGGGVTSVYVRLSHRIQKGQDIGGHRRT